MALGAPGAATALPEGPTVVQPRGALHSEIVSVRQVEPGVQRYLMRYGPLVAPAGQNLVLAGPMTIEKPPGDGYVQRLRPDLVGTDGVAPPVDVVHMHHAQLMNLSELDRVTPVHEGVFPTPLRIAGWAEEKTIASLPDPYGYPVKANDVWAVNYMLHNATPQSHVVYMELELDWVPAATPAAARLKPAYPLWFDVRNSEAYPVFDVPRNSGRKGTARYPDDFPDAYKSVEGRPGATVDGSPNLNTWIADRDLTLVAGAGHLHPGGLYTDLRMERDGKKALAFRSTAHYFDPNGPVSWDMAMEFTPPDWRVAVRKGDRLDVSTVYDTQRASWYEAMGIMLFFYTLDDPGADPFADKVKTSGEVTHGHLAAASNHGGGPSGLPDPSTLPDGATVQDSVGIADFVYTPGDTSAGGQLGLPPVVDPGNPLTFVNFDAAAQVPHTITSCREPCNRTTGISYPLADGDVQFDSGQLGYGTPEFGAFAQRDDWRTPDNLDPGTYTYFCRVHPYMRGAFRVRGTPKPKPPSGGEGGSGGPSVRVRSKRSTADRKGRVRVKVACGGGSGKCTGKLLLQAAVSGRTRTLGAARYSVKAGRSASVRVQLTRSARSLLRRRGSLRASAVARGPQGAVTRSVVLRAPRG
jgi:plastocyanin